MPKHESEPNGDYSLKVYSPDEIEFFTQGDRREIDRLLLHGINNLAIVLVKHAKDEEHMFHGLGTPEEVKIRSEWVDAQIKAQGLRNNMMTKVAESSVTWAVIIFLGFTLKAIVEYAYTLIRAKVG